MDNFLNLENGIIQMIGHRFNWKCRSFRVLLLYFFLGGGAMSRQLFAMRRASVDDLVITKDPLSLALSQIMSIAGCLSLVSFARQFIEIEKEIIFLVDLYRKYAIPISDFLFGWLFNIFEIILDISIPNWIKEYLPASVVFFMGWLRVWISHIRFKVTFWTKKHIIKQDSRLSAPRLSKWDLFLISLGKSQPTFETLLPYRHVFIGILLAIVWPIMVLFSMIIYWTSKQKEKKILISVSEKRYRSSSGAPNIHDEQQALKDIKLNRYVYGTVLTTFLYFLVLLCLNEALGLFA